MKLKNGFTLAEILITLMVLGVVAVLSISAIMPGVQLARTKTAYKKAYNYASSIAAKEKVAGELSSTITDDATKKLFKALSTELNISGYTTQKVSAGANLSLDKYKAGINIDGDLPLGKQEGGITSATLKAPNSETQAWIATDDNIAYTVIKGEGSGECLSKIEVNSKTTFEDTIKSVCNIIIVDINGLSKAPNSLEKQAAQTLIEGTNVTILRGDQFYIFVARDGIATGNKVATLSGRIIGDVK